MYPTRSVLLLALCLMPPACGPAPPRTEAPPQGVERDVEAIDEETYDEETYDEPPAPWSSPPLAAASVPAVYVAEWRRAENRAVCALIAPAALGQGEGATPRRANFGGGWAVAYDLPERRSAFGVAGTGLIPNEPAPEPLEMSWPHGVMWSDGSRAGYGPEGGTGPTQLAYLRIEGQECLYNIWSNLGMEHLEELLGQLRFVETEGGAGQ